MRGSLRALLVADSDEEAQPLLGELRRSFAVDSARVAEEESLRAALEERTWDIILCGSSAARLSVSTARAVTRDCQLDVPLLVVAGAGEMEQAVASLTAGASDCFASDALGPRFVAAIERECFAAAVRRELAAANAALGLSQSMVFTAEASAEVKLTFISQNVAGLLGYAPTECLAIGWWRERLHPDDGPIVLAAVARALNGERGTTEHRFRHQSGSWRWLSVQLLVERKSLIGSWRDLTDDRAMREQLLIADRTMSMGLLAAGVAHGINNPLASVMANVDMAGRDVRERARALGVSADFSEVRAALDDAHEGAVRIRDVVRDLRLVARPQDEKTGPVDAERVMESALHLAANELLGSARVVTSYGKAPPVEASEARLGQVFFNIIVNAAQAMAGHKKGGNELRVSTGTDASGAVVVIEITDNGPGMPPEVLHRLFTPFFTTKAVGQGTGLGLSISHRIVTGFGGSLDVSSDVGKGTTFRISLPRARAGGSVVAPAPAPSKVAATRGRVLVIDDEPMITRALQRILSEHHDVTTLGSAEEALQRLAGGERFDVILCDLMMPGMTGMDLHAELLHVAPEQVTRMLFLTGGAFTPRAKAFLDDPAHERIEKPFNAAHLRALINERIR